MTILLKSALIFDSSSPFHQQQKDILIENGIISKIANTIKNTSNFEEINLKNLNVSQGWFDSSVCFGEPGFEERETIENGLKTAAKSGFTAGAVNPNKNPVADNTSYIEFLKNTVFLGCKKCRMRQLSLEQNKVKALTKFENYQS